MKYYMPMRPPSIGTHPKDVKSIECFDVRTKMPNGVWTWAVLEYDRQLTEKEIYDYELVEVQE